MNISFLDNDYWTTQQGERVYPTDFEDSHLINTIKFIENNLNRYASNIRPLEELHAIDCMHPSGDGAYDCFQAELSIMEKQSNEDWLNNKEIYKLLKKEAKRRKLIK